MKWTCLTAFFLLTTCLCAQDYTHQDSLRGAITPEREWWDLTYYDLDIEVFPEERRILGQNTIRYEVLKPAEVLQIDLQAPLQLMSASQDGEPLEVKSDGNAHFIQLKKAQQAGAIEEIVVTYGGIPREAVRAPWDGGFSWSKDANGDHFIATSCQGLGASVWWPCKDHMYDEVDSMRISATVPADLVAVCNGRLEGVTDGMGGRHTKTYHWKVVNPINNYGVNVNIANYVGWEETYAGEQGELDLYYWALKVDEDKARIQYQDVPRMLEAFEHWFGPYPFYEDGYKLVQVPYLGMEHQSSITYGNQFKQGYLGRDLSGTGWGLKSDFIIIHESGHEWFANNITHEDLADMWIHESFTNYSESLFIEYYYGKEAGQEYVRGTRTGIQNQEPMVGDYHVNDQSYPGDVYPKGGNMLNTLRTIIADDEKWRSILRGLNEHFYHQTTNSAEIEAYIDAHTDSDLKPFFDQYLRDERVPTFEYYFKDEQLYYRWTNCRPDFTMWLEVEIAGEGLWFTPETQWKSHPHPETPLEVNPNFYVSIMKSR